MLRNPPSTALASTVVLLSAALWGLYWMPLRWLEAGGIDDGWAVALLNAPSGVLMMVVVASRWQQCRHQLRYAIAIGICTGLGLALYATGLLYSSVVRATLLFYLTPIWATLIGIAWLGEQTNWQRWAAIGAGLAGLILLMSGNGAVALNIGDAYALASGVLWAFGAAMIKRYDQVPVASMTMVQFSVTAIAAVVLGQLAGSTGVPAFAQMMAMLPVATVLSIAVFLPAVWVLFWAQKFLFPGRVGLLMMTEVLTATISASIFLPQERLSALEWCGAGLIVAACLGEVLASRHDDKDSTRAQPD